jgi:mono/diheme cytochrome c family protein
MVNMNTRLLLLIVLASLLAACGAPASGNLTPQEKLGRAKFVQQCAACHAIEADAVIVGPSLFGIAKTAATRVPGMDARSFIEESILEPSAFLNAGYSDLMPKTFGQTLDENELDAVIAYLYTLQ